MAKEHIISNLKIFVSNSEMLKIGTSPFSKESHGTFLYCLEITCQYLIELINREASYKKIRKYIGKDLKSYRRVNFDTKDKVYCKLANTVEVNIDKELYIFLNGYIAYILVLLGLKKKSIKEAETLKKELFIFKKLGFILNEGIDLSEFEFEKWSSDYTHMESPFELAYQTLGYTAKGAHCYHITDRRWSFDVKAINGPGSYVKIIKNLERISRGTYTFTNIKDSIDYKKNRAVVSFDFDGMHYKREYYVNNDMVDANIFQDIVRITKDKGAKERYTVCYVIGAISYVIGFETPESVDKIKADTGLNIIWL